MAERATGYYWVWLDGGWEPALWSAERGAWALVNSDIPLSDVPRVGPRLTPPSAPGSPGKTGAGPRAHTVSELLSRYDPDEHHHDLLPEGQTPRSVIQWLGTPIAEPPYDGRPPRDLLGTPAERDVMRRLRAWLDAPSGHHEGKGGQ